MREISKKATYTSTKGTWQIQKDRQPETVMVQYIDPLLFRCLTHCHLAQSPERESSLRPPSDQQPNHWKSTGLYPGTQVTAERRHRAPNENYTLFALYVRRDIIFDQELLKIRIRDPSSFQGIRLLQPY